MANRDRSAGARPSTMRAAQLVGSRDYRLVETPVPAPGPGQALVRITHVGICGSDLSFWQLRHTLNELHPPPAPPGSHGHEAAGVIVEVGARVRGVRVGDRVVRINLVRDRDWDMRCFAEYALADRPIVVNEGHPRRVCFADPLAVALIHAQAVFDPAFAGRRAGRSLERVAIGRPRRGRQPPVVVVRGMGFIGVLVALLLRGAGATPVALEVEPAKIEAARCFGIDCRNAREPDALARIREDYGPAAGAVECCGASDLDELAALLGELGVCVVMGTSRVRVELLYRPLRERGLTVAFPSNAALQARHGRTYWEAAARLLERGDIDPLPMVDAVYPLADLQRALEETEAHPEWRRTLVEV